MDSCQRRGRESQTGEFSEVPGVSAVSGYTSAIISSEASTGASTEALAGGQERCDAHAALSNQKLEAARVTPADISKNLPQQERSLLTWWRELKIFERSLELTRDTMQAEDASKDEGTCAETFTFFDGPPFATGLPHYGHLLAGTLKDVVPRYQTMQGRYVPRRFGWDCHGLPIETIVEKKLGLSGSASIKAYGIERFNEACRSNVLTYASQWKSVVERAGRWVDFDRAYKTMDTPYMESVWWVLKQLHEKGLLYKGYKVMPYSWKLGTPLSNFEASENYQEVDDPSVAVLFPLRGKTKAYVAWTTTPWTLVSNLALAVHPDIDYVEVKIRKMELDPSEISDSAGVARPSKSGGVSWVNLQDYDHLILAKSRLDSILEGYFDYEVVRHVKGRELIGEEYLPLFDTFASHAERGAFRILKGDFVGEDEGTGIVHLAPAFGEDDCDTCQAAGIDLVCPVDVNGCFDQSVSFLEGKHYLEGGKEILSRLKESGRLLWQKSVRHRYPFCWRSDTPLIYRACDTWFISVTTLKDQLIKANQQIRWVPEHIKQGRFGKWLENARDWAISRNRFWGTPIPIWESDDGEIILVGSIDELEELTGERPEDLHRHLIDHLTIERDGKVFKRIEAVFDCWFESGSMPYGQRHYPFEEERADEQKGSSETSRPDQSALCSHSLPALQADFIAEGLDQTRGWFYTLNVLSVALFNRPAFKNVIVNGIILAGDGAKMSKRLQNYPDPVEVIEKYGADALRLYLLKSPVVRAEDLCFNERDVEQVMRQIILPCCHSCQFFLTYANLYGYSPAQESCSSELPLEARPDLDRWILSRVHGLTSAIEETMEAYRLWEAIDPIVTFIDELTNWYIRRSRRRFWSDEETPDRKSAFTTLYIVLVTLAKVSAPFMPFLSETIYGALRRPEDPISVHLCRFPQAGSIDQRLCLAMEGLQKVVGMGHALRKEHKLRVRQPLATLSLAVDSQLRQLLEGHEDILQEELNVKKVQWIEDSSQILKPRYKLNFRLAGKRLGPLMKTAQRWVSDHMTAEHWNRLQHLSEESTHQVSESETAASSRGEMDDRRTPSPRSLGVTFEGVTFDLHPSEVTEEFTVREGIVAEYSQGICVGISTQITPELLQEGYARELINKINTARKGFGFDITDRVKIYLESAFRELLTPILHRFQDQIFDEVLALEVIWSSDLAQEKLETAIQECPLGTQICRYRLERVRKSSIASPDRL